QPIAGIQATCRTPEVEAKIAVLRAEIAEREPKDEGARKVVTSMMLNGMPISTNSDTYRQFYGYLQNSMRRRRELEYLEGLPPCPPPAATTTTVTTVGPVPQIQPIGGWTAPPPSVYGTGAVPPPSAYG